MALTHVTAIRNSLADLVVDAIDAGVTDAQGDLIFLTAAEAEVATLPCSNPAFGNGGAVVAGRADANNINDDTNATGGTVDHFKFQDRDNSEVFRGSVTVTGGGGDIEITSTVIGAGDTVSLATFQYTASA